MPEAGTQVLFLCKAELGFFHFLEIVTCWLLPSAGQKIPVVLAGTCHRRRSRLLKTGFFGQVRELKIQRKNPGSGLRKLKMPHGILHRISATPNTQRKSPRFYEQENYRMME